MEQLQLDQTLMSGVRIDHSAETIRPDICGLNYTIAASTTECDYRLYLHMIDILCGRLILDDKVLRWLGRYTTIFHLLVIRPHGSRVMV